MCRPRFCIWKKKGGGGKEETGWLNYEKKTEDHIQHPKSYIRHSQGFEQEICTVFFLWMAEHRALEQSALETLLRFQVSLCHAAQESTTSETPARVLFRGEEPNGPA